MLPTPVRSGMLVGGGLVVLGAALGVGLLDGAPHHDDGPAPRSARTGEGGAAQAPAGQHTDPAPSLTAQPRRTATPSAGGSSAAPSPAPATSVPSSSTTDAPGPGGTAPTNQPPAATGTRPGHGHGLAKGHHKH